MEVVTLQSEAFQEIMKRMDEMSTALTQKQKNPQDVFLDNQEFIQLLYIPVMLTHPSGMLTHLRSRQ